MEIWNTTDLVSFGNYLLSDRRKQYIDPDQRDQVHHADRMNWIDDTINKQSA